VGGLFDRIASQTDPQRTLLECESAADPQPKFDFSGLSLPQFVPIAIGSLVSRTALDHHRHHLFRALSAHLSLAQAPSSLFFSSPSSSSPKVSSMKEATTKAPSTSAVSDLVPLYIDHRRCPDDIGLIVLFCITFRNQT
jgi:hypothetical protein